MIFLPHDTLEFFVYPHTNLIVNLCGIRASGYNREPSISSATHVCVLSVRAEVASVYVCEMLVNGACVFLNMSANIFAC